MADVLVGARGLGIAGRTYVLPSVLGADGQALGLSDGRLAFISVGGTGSASSVAVTVDFGSGSDLATTVVTGQTWVTATSIISASLGAPTADHLDPAEGLIEQIHVGISDRVNGVGFTVTAHAPYRTTGTYTINCIGV